MNGHDWTGIEVSWLGLRYRFRRGDHLVLARTKASSVCLWPPTDPADTEHPCPRDCWIADKFIRHVGFIEAKGTTAQEALDALAEQLPFERLVMGGVA